MATSAQVSSPSLTTCSPVSMSAQALRKNRVSPFRYRKWLKNPLFKREFVDRKESLERQRKFILISSLPQAVRRLAELIHSEKDEIARKACMDILNIMKADEEKEEKERAERAGHQSHMPQISEAKAAKIWAVLAEPDESENNVVGGMARSDAEPAEAVRGHVSSFTQHPASSTQYPEDILAGAAICGISSSLLAETFPDGLPYDYIQKLCDVAESPARTPIVKKLSRPSQKRRPPLKNENA